MGSNAYLSEHQDTVKGDVKTPNGIANRHHSKRQLWEIFDHIIEQLCYFFF